MIYTGLMFLGLLGVFHRERRACMRIERANMGSPSTIYPPTVKQIWEFGGVCEQRLLQWGVL